MNKSDNKLQVLLEYVDFGLHIFPLKANGKTPLTKHGHNDASNDFAQIKKWHDQYPHANWGIATGKTSDCFVIDVDVKNGKRGAEMWKLLKKIFPNLYPTKTCKTTTGGKHYYYKYPRNNHVGSLNGFLDGIDIKGDGGYVVSPPSILNDIPYEWRDEQQEIVNAPDSLFPLLEYGKKIAPPVDVKEGERNESIFKYACHLMKQNLPREQAEQFVLVAASMCNPPFPEDEAIKCLESAYSGKYAPTSSANDTVDNDGIEQIVDTLNKQYAVVMFGSKCLILKEKYNPMTQRKEITFLPVNDFRNFFANKCEIIRKKETTWGKIWFQHPDRRQYDGIVFMPQGLPQDISENYYNLWIDYGCEAKEGDCSLFLEHIRSVICSDDEELYEYVIAWMADAIQNPANRPGTALVLRGSQGTGKGVFAKIFGALFGQHFLHITHQKHLTGHFNAHLMSVCLIFADEAVWGGNKSEEGVLKALVTEETIPIEAKGKDVVNLDNHVRLVIASNNRWVVPAGLEERRFVVIDVSNKKMQNHKYFSAIYEQMENGGKEALLYYLKNYDLRGINLRKIPQTEALAEMKHYSMSPVEKFWFDKLSAGAIKETDDYWSDCIPFGDLYDEYCKHSNRSGNRYRGALTQFAGEIRHLLPFVKISKRQIRVDGLGVKKQVKCYELPILEKCRKHFDMIMQTSNVWDDECAITTITDKNS